MWDIPIFLKRDATIAISAGILGFLVDYALNLLLSHLLNAHEFGDYRFALAFSFFCATVVVLGGDRAAPRMLAAPLDQAKYGIAWEYLRFYGVLGLLLSGIIIVSVWSGNYFYHGIRDPEDHHAVGIMVLAIPFMAAGALASRTLQTAGRTFLAAMPWRVGAPVLLLAALMATQFLTNRTTLYEVLWLSCLAIVVVTLAQGVMVKRHALKVVTFAPESREPRQWLGLSVPIMGAFLVNMGLGQSDLFFLEWLGTERAVGHYAAAITSAHFVILIQTSIIAIFAPLVARDLQSSSVQASAALLQGQKIMVMALGPIIIGLILAAVPVMRLFGTDYPEVAPALRLLIVANGVWALAALSALWLEYRGHGKTVVLITALTLLVDSILNASLIPTFGPLGAAASSAVTSIGAAAVTVWLALRIQRAP